MRSVSKSIRSVERQERGTLPLAGRLLGVLALGLLALGGCSDLKPVTPFEPERDGSKLFSALTLDHRAINLSLEAPYNTIQLKATPRNQLGEPMEGLPAPTFRSTDTVSVWVTADGVVQARRATSGVQIIAELVTGANVRHVDTAVVKVTSVAAPPEVASFEILFDSPEQKDWPMTTGDFGFLAGVYFTIGGLPIPGSRTVAVDIRDSAGNPIPGLEVDYISLDPKRIRINRRTGVVETVLGPPGETATIVARTTAYGKVRADTATIKVVGPEINGYMVVEIDQVRSWPSSEVVISPGGVVSWYYVQNGGTSFGINFEDHTNIEPVTELCTALGLIMPHFCGSGDIVIPGNMNEAHYRRFTKPGVYRFETTDGFKGQVRVVEDDDPFWSSTGVEE